MESTVQPGHTGYTDKLIDAHAMAQRSADAYGVAYYIVKTPDEEIAPFRVNQYIDTRTEIEADEKLMDIKLPATMQCVLDDLAHLLVKSMCFTGMDEAAKHEWFDTIVGLHQAISQSLHTEKQQVTVMQFGHLRERLDYWIDVLN